MKYYKIDIKRRYPDIERISSSANGRNVPNNEDYFDKIRKGEIIKNTPVFDYFVLTSFDEEPYWEWALFDVHDGMGDYPGNSNWYVSNDLKLLLENFKIAPKYHFYETKLLYKDEKLKYWIFQYGVEAFTNYNLSESDFSINNNSIKIQSEIEYWEKKREARKKYQSVLKIERLSITNSYDFIFNQINADILVSQNLRNAIETMGITGFEFSELDYEVVIDL